MVRDFVVVFVTRLQRIIAEGYLIPRITAEIIADQIAVVGGNAAGFDSGPCGGASGGPTGGLPGGDR